MSLPILTAAERCKEHKGIKCVLLGHSGVGKTTQLQSLNADTTLFVDLEAGDLPSRTGQVTLSALQPGRSSETLLYFWVGLILLSGMIRCIPQRIIRRCARSMVTPTRWKSMTPTSLIPSRYWVVFASNGVKDSPRHFQKKRGKPDTRGAYGLHGQEMIAALTHLQHARGKNVVFVAILEERVDDFNRKLHQPQIEGSKTGLELPGIVDQVVTLASLPDEEGNLRRTFVCQTLNPYGYPAKDRSGRLDRYEPPHLGQLFDKIRTGARQPVTFTSMEQE